MRRFASTAMLLLVGAVVAPTAYSAGGGFCGDGILQIEFEQCDDGNQTDGDGCDSNCRWTILIPPNECMSPVACLFDGFPNVALGSATLALNADANLVVSNIGSSGKDGVRQFLPLPGTVDMRTDLAGPNFSLSGPGTELATDQIGVVDGVPGRLFSRFTITNTDGSELRLVGDMSMIGATSYRIQLFLGRDLVADEGGLSSGRIFTDVVDIMGEDCRIGPDGEIELTGDAAVPNLFRIPTRGGFLADNWKISNEDSTQTPNLQRLIDVRGRDTGDLTMTGQFTVPQPGPFDCNADGDPDPDDNGNGVPDPCETLSLNIQADACPGPIELAITGGTPGGVAGVLFAVAPGMDSLQAGPCAGTETGLRSPQLLGVFTLDANGELSLQRIAPAGACGLFVQVVDGSTCTVSNVDTVS